MALVLEWNTAVNCSAFEESHIVHTHTQAHKQFCMRIRVWVKGIWRVEHRAYESYFSIYHWQNKPWPTVWIPAPRLLGGVAIDFISSEVIILPTLLYFDPVDSWNCVITGLWCGIIDPNWLGINLFSAAVEANLYSNLAHNKSKYVFSSESVDAGKELQMSLYSCHFQLYKTERADNFATVEAWWHPIVVRSKVLFF